jgi:dTDP-4-amino-4,6-dideoxygalactose transaminase
MKDIYVTQPQLPDLEAFTALLKEIWASHRLTNNGPLHQRLEQELADHLGVPHLSLFNNGTIALMMALRALELQGEVITTPFSFVATTHAIAWNGLRPVFSDINPETFNLDPAGIEAAITPETCAIMPVHCYGTPCDVAAIEDIARRHDLKVIYDAAHAFDVRDEGGSVLRHGDLSVLSFHATKVFSTLEGGAIVARDAETKLKIDRLKNFGFVNEIEVDGIGLNGKMNEVQAAFGLLQLNTIDEALASRARIAERYRDAIAEKPGLTCLPKPSSWRENNSYFPVLVGNDYPLTRDGLYDVLRENCIYARRYFYPLISDLPAYSSLKSAQVSNLPIAERIADQILCLPIYPDLQDAELDRILTVI